MAKKEQNHISEEDDDSEGTSSSLDIMDTCSGCACRALDDKNEQHYDLSLCESCPRVFCKQCIAIAHGGNAVTAGSSVESSADNHKVGKCIYCEPTNELIRMQMSIQQLNVDSQIKTDERDVVSDPIEKKVDHTDEVVQKCFACDVPLNEKCTMDIEDKRVEQSMDISTYLYSTHVHPLLRYVLV